MFGNKGFAKGIAKAQLRSYLACRSKYPTMQPEELYLMALKLRRTASEELIRGWIDESANFQEVVTCLVGYEYVASGRNIGLEELDDIEDAVSAVIPANI